MPRRAGYYWDKREQAYRTDVGGRTTYFRGIAREDVVGAARRFGEHLDDLAAAARPPEADVLDLCLAFVAAERGTRPRTAQSHKERLTKFCTWPPADPFGPRPARSLGAGDLRDALAAWQKAGHSPHYLAGICRSVKAAFRWAASDRGKVIPAYPFEGVKAPAVGRAPNRYAERREVAAFLRFVWRRADALPEGVRLRFARRLVLLVRVAAYTGARPGTLASAWWSDFDPKKRTITLPPDRHKTGHKTGKPLVLFLTPSLARALRRELARADRHPVSIFTHERGKGAVARGSELGAGDPWGKFTRLADGRTGFDPDIKPLCRQIHKLRKQAMARGEELKAAGKPTGGLELIRDEGDNRFVLYRLRHTRASDDIMAGGNPATVAALLGTSVKMLDTTYAHLQDDHLARTAAELAEANRRRRGAGGKAAD